MFVCSDSELFWIERKKNFIKICFPFTPEFDEELNQVDFIYKKISAKIAVDDYKIFSINKRNGNLKITLTANFSPDGVIQILVPREQKIDVNFINKLLIEKNYRFNEISHLFYSIDMTNLQKKIKNSYIITQCLITNSNEFSFHPNTVEPYNLAIYSVDIYGTNIDKIDFELN